jgi:hypothetical protein
VSNACGGPDGGTFPFGASTSISLTRPARRDM